MAEVLAVAADESPLVFRHFRVVDRLWEWRVPGRVPYNSEIRSVRSRFWFTGFRLKNPVNQKLTEMHMAGHRVRLDSNLLRVRLHMSSVHGIYQRDPVNWITRTCRPRGSTSQYCTQMMCDFVWCGVLRRGKCSFGEMKPVLRGVPGISGMARNQHVRYRFRVVAQSVLKFR